MNNISRKIISNYKFERSNEGKKMMIISEGVNWIVTSSIDEWNGEIGDIDFCIFSDEDEKIESIKEMEQNYKKEVK